MSRGAGFLDQVLFWDIALYSIDLLFRQAIHPILIVSMMFRLLN